MIQHNISLLIKILSICYFLFSRDVKLEASTNDKIIIAIIRSKQYQLSRLFGNTGYHFIILYELSEDKAYIADPDNYSRTRKAMKLKSFRRRIESLPDNITHPYIYVKIN